MVNLLTGLGSRVPLAVYSVASLGEAGGRPPRGVTPKEKILWLNLQRIVDKRGRTGKKGAG